MTDVAEYINFLVSLSYGGVGLPMRMRETVEIWCPNVAESLDPETGNVRPAVYPDMDVLAITRDIARGG